MVTPMRALALLLLLALPLAAQETRHRSRVDVAARDERAADVLAAIVSSTGARILVGPEVTARVTLTLRDVPWRDAVGVIVRQARLTLEELPAGAVRISQPQRYAVHLHDAPARTALLLLARQADRDIVIGPDVGGRVSLDLPAVTLEQALFAVASQAGAVILAERDETRVQGGGRDAPPPLRVVAGTFEQLDVARDRTSVAILTRDEGRVVATLPADPAEARRLRAALDRLPRGARVAVALDETGAVRHVVASDR